MCVGGLLRLRIAFFGMWGGVRSLTPLLSPQDTVVPRLPGCSKCSRRSMASISTSLPPASGFKVRSPRQPGKPEQWERRAGRSVFAKQGFFSGANKTTWLLQSKLNLQGKALSN